MRNIQREEFGGRAANGGEVRIQQVPKNLEGFFSLSGYLKQFGRSFMLRISQFSTNLEGFSCQNISVPAGCRRFQPAQEEPQD